MNLQFVGVGTLFSGHDQYQSNMVVTALTGKKMLIDCGSDARFSLAERGIQPTDLDAVYVSHLHSDHIGGIEWLALSTFFSQSRKRLKLIGEKNLLGRLWEHSLKGGLECIGGKCMYLDDYFDCCPLAEEGSFDWEGIGFTLVKMLHVIGAPCNHYSYGLRIAIPEYGGHTVFLTADTLYQPDLITRLSKEVDVIFHDCETSPVRTTVHAHYDELCTLPISVREKMWLYHYQTEPGYQPLVDGFKGFVVKGQEFSFSDRIAGRVGK